MTRRARTHDKGSFLPGWKLDPPESGIRTICHPQDGDDSDPKSEGCARVPLHLGWSGVFAGKVFAYCFGFWVESKGESRKNVVEGDESYQKIIQMMQKNHENDEKNVDEMTKNIMKTSKIMMKWWKNDENVVKTWKKWCKT